MKYLIVILNTFILPLIHITSLCYASIIETSDQSDQDNLRINSEETRLSIFKKVNLSDTEIEHLQETGRAEFYTKDSYSLSSPFGIFVAYNREEEMVGIECLSPHLNDGVLYASQMTDVFEMHQGQGYASILRREVALWLKPFIGQTVMLTNESFRSEYVLSFLHSDNEWCWGQGHASLASCLSADFGIVMIASCDVVHMVYPKTESTWTTERTIQFKNISSYIYNKIHNTPSSLTEDSVVEDFNNMLSSFDFSQEVDLNTFLNIHMNISDEIKSDRSLEKHLPIKEHLILFFKNLNPEQKQMVIDFLENKKTKNPQKFPIQLLHFRINSYNKGKLLNEINELFLS